MAKIVGIGTGFSGKVGNLVYQHKKGSQVVKTLYKPTDKKTKDQVIKRSIFSDLNTIFKPLAPSLIKEFWNPYVIGKRSGWSEILSANQKLQTGSNIDFSKLLISHGSLPGENIDVCTLNGKTGNIRVTWVGSHSAGSTGDDFAKLLIYSSPLNLWFSSDGTDVRSDESIDVPFPAGDLVPLPFCYLFFFLTPYTFPPGNITSNSSFKQCVIV